MRNTPIKAAWITPIPPFFVAVLLTFALLSAYAAESRSDEDSKTEDLAKESQNPIANLISVPFQNNFNFGIGPNDSTQWDLNVQPVIPITFFEQGLESYHTDHYTYHQPALSRSRSRERVRARRHQPHCFPLAEEFRQTALGRWTNNDVSDGDRIAARQWQVECGTLHRGTDHTGALGDRRAGKQSMVFCGVGQKERECAACPTVR